MSDDAPPEAPPVEAVAVGEEEGGEPRRRRHKRHHRGRSRRHERRPRVNPVFLWVKQDDCRIVSVYCEDYDKRNRITITKTSHGWRAIPKTERFSSVLAPRNNVMAPNAASVVATPCRGDDSGADNDKENDATTDEREGCGSVAEEGETVVQERGADGETTGAVIEVISSDLHRVDTQENQPDSYFGDIEAILKEDENMFDCDDASRDIYAETVRNDSKWCEDSNNKSSDENKAVERTAEPDIAKREEEDIPKNEEEAVSHRPELTIDDLPGDITIELAKPGSACPYGLLAHEGDDGVVDLPEELLAELRETFEKCDEPSDDNNVHSPVNTSLVAAAATPPPITKEYKGSFLSPEELKARLPAALQVTVVRDDSPSTRPWSLSQSQPANSRPRQHKFLESLLASPKKSEISEEVTVQREPLDLINPPETTVRPRTPVHTTAPPCKKPKLDDITLRHLLSRQPGLTVENGKRVRVAAKARRSSEPSMESATASAAHKSRLLELLKKEGGVDADPLAQLKLVLSDPDLMVPDPLLVPRSRLHALVTSPAQEIPRLLAQSCEARVPYPGDTLAVPLSHLTSLLQPAAAAAVAAGIPPSAYQHPDVLLQQQMMWLPYLEAVYNSGMVTPPGSNHPDYKAQVELQSALALWQDAVLKGTYEQLLHNNNNNFSSSNKNLKCKYPPSLLPVRTTHPSPALSPTGIGTGTFAAPQRPHQYQQQRQQQRLQRQLQQQQQLEYQQQLLLLQQLQQYQQQQQLLQQFQQFGKRDILSPSPPPPTTSTTPLGNRTPHPYARPNTPSTPPGLRLSPAPPCYASPFPETREQPPVSPTQRTRTPPQKSGHSLVDRVEKHSNNSSVAGQPERPSEKPVNRPKLKVKNLVDPNAQPRLLQIQQSAQGLSSGLPLRPGAEDDASAPHLWHPLFGSQKAYTGPWQWTTVTVNGE